MGVCSLAISTLIINIPFLNHGTNYLQNGLFLLLLLVSVTKFIKSLGLHVDVYICYSPLSYNKRDLEEGKKEIFIYLTILRMFIGKWQAIQTSGPLQGDTEWAAGVWIQQLVTVFCWLPGCHWALHMETCHHFCHGHQGLLCQSELALNKQGIKLLAFMVRTQEHHAVAEGGPFVCTSQLRMLKWQWSFQPGMGRDWRCFFLLGAAPGLSTTLVAL